ncbi:MAG: cupredoxin domain-containing protein, partial [Actinobacteria bacterium]|nr:cupredoxin domain-containing protein [Actinomycetota bacterium]
MASGPGVAKEKRKGLTSNFMPARTKLAIALTAIAASAGLSFTTPPVSAQQANPTITIDNTGGDPPYTFTPAKLDAKVGQAITIKNNDTNGVHNVTAKDQSFSVDVPPQSSATLTVKKAGTYPYYCQYHTDGHN